MVARRAVGQCLAFDLCGTYDEVLWRTRGALSFHEYILYCAHCFYPPATIRAEAPKSRNQQYRMNANRTTTTKATTRQDERMVCLYILYMCRRIGNKCKLSSYDEGSDGRVCETTILFYTNIDLPIATAINIHMPNKRLAMRVAGETAPERYILIDN